jgi:uncharacterized protein YbjT (DUF2867 family)
MKTALIAGASGLTGSYLLQHLLESDTYNYVKALVRKPLNIEHPKLAEIVFDFDQPDPGVIKAEHVYCALGTTIKKAGSKEAFRKVDYEYPLQIAKTAYENGAKKFATVSAMGANTKSMFFYNRVKGQTEEALKQIPFEAIYIARPSMLLGPRKEYRLGEELGKKLMTSLGFLLPGNMKAVHASKVANCLVNKMNNYEKGIHIIPSGEIRAFRNL